jgi:hypothetical protein
LIVKLVIALAYTQMNSLPTMLDVPCYVTLVTMPEHSGTVLKVAH